MPRRTCAGGLSAACALVALHGTTYGAELPVLDPAAEAKRQANPGLVVADSEAGFETPYRLQADGRVLDTGYMDASPFLVDWDNDGDRDLLVGAMGPKGICLFTNTGDDNTPEYTNSGWLEVAGNEPLAVPGIG